MRKLAVSLLSSVCETDKLLRYLQYFKSPIKANIAITEPTIIPRTAKELSVYGFVGSGVGGIGPLIIDGIVGGGLLVLANYTL